MEEKEKIITIGDIVHSKGAVRTKRLKEFLKTCTERQRAFLMFYGYSPITVPEDCILPYKYRNTVIRSIINVDEYSKWERLGDTMRDLYLKLYITREGAGKILSYISAYVAKIDDAIAAANIINKALAYIPKEDRLETFQSMQEEYNKTSTLAIEGDTIKTSIVFNSRTKKAVADTKETYKMIKVAEEQYLEMIGELKAFEKVFDSLAVAVGEDICWIYPERLDILLKVFRKEDTFTIAYKDRLPNVDINIPMLKDAPINQDAYEYLNNVLAEWIAE